MNHANSFNQVILIGRVGQNPEIKTSKGKNPTAFVTFSVATYKRFQGGKKSTNWTNVSYWGPKAAEWAAQYVKRGMLIQVNGEISSRKWTGKDGVERRITDVRGYEIILLSSPRVVVDEDQEAPAEQVEQRVETEQEHLERHTEALPIDSPAEVEDEEDLY